MSGGIQKALLVSARVLVALVAWLTGVCLLAARVLFTVIIWSMGFLLLSRLEYFAAFGEIDHIAGIMPVLLVLTALAGTSVLAWGRHTRRNAPVSMALALLVFLSCALFPTALRGDWWFTSPMAEDAEAGPDLSVYAPFSPGSKTATLDEASTLTLNSDLPVLDGATALYPVYAALAASVYARDAFSSEYVLCANTRGAYAALLSGTRDIIFAAGPSEGQMAAAKAAGVTLRFTPIGREAFVFVTGKGNPIQSLSYRQIRNIYSGKTAYWKTLGWAEGGRIIAFQRPEGSGSQTGLQTIMGDIPVQAPQPLPDASLIGENSLMRQVSLVWNGVQPAIGYSYRYFATALYANPDAKLLGIDGVEPSIETIQNGRYPFTGEFYAVTRGEPQGNARLFIEWILSPQGQRIIERTGYVPIR